MRTFHCGLLVAAALLIPAAAQNDANPFVGRWDFNIVNHGHTGAAWLGITGKAGQLEVWYQPTGGNVYQVKDFHVDGSHLSVTVSPASGRRKAMTWDLDAPAASSPACRRAANSLSN